MRINYNVSASIANKNLLGIESNLSQSMERLSSGLKINHAKDNPAGMAISRKMKAQIDGLDRASANASDGISVIHISDGALGEVTSILQRMRELSVQAASDATMGQEDKEAIFDAVDTLELCLKTVTPMLDTMKTIPANMRRAAAKGFINATDCADYLTKKGMPFRDAYKLTGCMVSDCIAKDKTLEELTLDEFKGYSALFENDIYDAIDLVKCCEGRTSYGGPSEASVNNQIALANAQLDAWEEKNA